jgi:hypothetical protein
MDSKHRIEVEPFGNPRYAYVRVKAEVLGVRIDAIRETRGRLNGSPILGCDTQTLMLVDITLPPARDNGTYSGEAQLTFIYNALGWNSVMAYRPAASRHETGRHERATGDFYKPCHFAVVYGFDPGLVAEVPSYEEGQTDTERAGDRTSSLRGGKPAGSIPPGAEQTCKEATPAD